MVKILFGFVATVAVLGIVAIVAIVAIVTTFIFVELLLVSPIFRLVF